MYPNSKQNDQFFSLNHCIVYKGDDYFTKAEKMKDCELIVQYSVNIRYICICMHVSFYPWIVSWDVA